ncbi:hypothetical protein LJD73_15610, partial [Faecalibacillus intestinalis]|nr:hypothetical protein [Faecalibacillus intestinalis]MCG4715444.1 hypothetical protein [Faecalibacillus intestinalis]MCG4756658.1 hypothetical protein [Faecalibacillus intestinalis]
EMRNCKRLPVIPVLQTVTEITQSLVRHTVSLLKKTAHELGKCVVVVTHSKHLAEEADEILEIKNGAISFLSE